VVSRSRLHPTESESARGPVVWLALILPLVAWMAHLISEAALTRLACTDSLRWVLHLLTAVFGAMAVVGIAISYAIVRAAGPALDEESASPRAVTRMLGLLGVAWGAANLLLIVAEGAGVIFLSPCTR
jgi:hypothetical protein